MPDPMLYLKAIGATTIVSTLFVLAMVRMRRLVSAGWTNSVCVVGIGLGFIAGFCVLSLRWSWPPANGLDRFLTIIAPAALGIELLSGLQCVPRWLAWSLRVGLAVTIPRILLHDSVYLSGADNSGSPWQLCAALAAGGALLVAVWGLLSWLSRRTPGISIPLAIGLTIQCAGLVVMMAGYIKGGAAAFPLAATLVTTTIGMGLNTKHFRPPAILGIGAVSLFGVLFIGRFFGRLSTICSLSLLLAPLLCWITELPLLRHRQPWFVESLRLVLVATLLAVVLAIAKNDFDRKMAPLLGSVHASSNRFHNEAGSPLEPTHFDRRIPLSH